MAFLKPKTHYLKPRSGQAPRLRSGQAALSLVLLVGGTVVLIAATLFFLVLSFINSTFGFQAANQAWGLAVSGANDALLQLSRNPVMNDESYEFDIDNHRVKVDIDRGCLWIGGSMDCMLEVESLIKKADQVLIVSSVSVLGRSSVLTVFASVSSEGKVDVIEVRYYVSPTGEGAAGA